MTIEVGIGQVALNNTATVDLTSTKTTAAPKGVLAILGDGGINGTLNGDWRHGMGSTDGTRQSYAGIESRDNVGSSNTKRQANSSIVVQRTVGTSANRDVLGHNSFLSNGWRANHTSRGNFGKLAAAIMFGGTDVKAESGQFTLTGTGQTTINLVDTTLTPNVVIFYTVGAGANAAVGNDAWMSFGMAVDDGVSIAQKCWGHYHNDNEAIAVPQSRFDSTHAISQHTIWQATLDSFAAGLFRMTPTSSPGGDGIGFIALQIDNANLALIDVDMPTATGLNDETGPGFTPSFVMQVSGMATATDTDLSDATAGVINFSMFNDTDAYSYSFAEEDGVTTMNNHSLCDNKAVNYLEDDGATTAFAATFDSFTANGYQLNYSDVDPTVRKGFALAIGAASAGQTVAIGQATETDLSQPITASKSLSIGLSSETDTAQPMTVGGDINVAIGLTTETDIAQPIGFAKTKVIGLNVETDLAQIMVSAKARAFGLAIETDTSLPMSASKQTAIGQATETDVALDMRVSGPQTIIIGLATETDTALPLTPQSQPQPDKLADPGRSSPAVTKQPARRTSPRLYAKRWNMFAETFDAFLRRQESLVREVVRELPVAEVPQAVIETPEFQEQLGEVRNVIQERMQVSTPELIAVLEPEIAQMALIAQDEEDILAIVALIASDHVFLQ